MAAERHRTRAERRPAIWPWLVMPLIVLVVFLALVRAHHRPGTPWWAGGWGEPPSAADTAPAGQ
jgi:hypothetical protein